MSFYVSETLEDGATVVMDDSNPNTTYVLKPGQWAQVQAVKADQQRRVLDHLKEQNGDEWARERGPDSELATNMEAGTPTTDHSSDPV